MESLEEYPFLLSQLKEKVFFQREGSLLVAHATDQEQFSRFESQLKNKSAVPPTVVQVKTTCLTCNGLPILGAEALLLLIFFYMSNKITVFKKSASAVIPLGAYMAFIIFNGICGKNVFWCKYFVPIDIIIYILFVISNKYGYVFKKLDFFGHRFNKKNSK